jgi:hypothetical protein
MMLGPQLVLPDEMEWAGSIMGFALQLGVAAGSWLSFATLALVLGSNPFS